MRDSEAAREPAPWSPNLIAVLTVLLSLVPGGVLHAFNYRRLGQPEQVVPHLVAHVGVVLLVSGAYLYTDVSGLWLWGLGLIAAGYYKLSQDRLWRKSGVAAGSRFALLLPILLSVAGLALYVGSIIAFEVALDPHHDRQFERGMMLLDAGALDEAERVFLAYQRWDPEETAVYFNLALIYRRRGDLEGAREQLETALQLGADDPEIAIFLEEIEAEMAAARGSD